MKKYILIVLLLGILFIPSISSAVIDKNNSISILDMRYLLQKNLDNPVDVNEVWDKLHTISTLQGIVNRDTPNLYIKYIVENIFYKSDYSIDDYWLDKYRKPGEWLFGKEFRVLESEIEAIWMYKDQIKGMVVYDPAVASTSNVASAIAGIEDLIAIRYDTDPKSLYQQIKKSGLNLEEKVWLLNPDGTSMFTGTGMLPGLNIPSSGSIKNDPYLWFIEKYMKQHKCNTKYAAYYIDQYWRQKPKNSVPNHHTLTNHDFFVSKKAFFFDLSPWDDEPATDDVSQPIGTDYNTLKTMLRIAYEQNQGIEFCHIGGFPSWAFKYTKHAGGIHDDVPTEWRFVETISAYNAYDDGDAIGYGAMANASFWQHYPLKSEYKQEWITREELKKQGYLDDKGNIDSNKNYIIFYVGDYDASSWITQRTPSIWDDPNRGKLPLMWCISPVLQERAPMVMDNFRRTATANDYFASADNGAGYLKPGMLQEPRPISGLPSGLRAWSEHCKKYYKKWGLSITGFIIDGNAPGLTEEGFECYRSFSPNGIVPQKVPLTYLYKDMPVIRADEDINMDDPKQAAQQIVNRVKLRPVPFHWFRNILKTPSWYVAVMDEVKKLDSSIELLSAPAFFELYKVYLENNPDAASGEISFR